MGEAANTGTELVQNMTSSLMHAGLSWRDLDGKTVLDVGAGEVRLAQAAKLTGSTAKIFSVDMERRENWVGLPSDIKNQTIEAVADELPFPDNTFDMIVNIASAGALSIPNEIRVLKPGGEIRVVPIGGQILDMWNVACYLDEVEGWPQEKITGALSKYEQEMEANEGWRPKEYADFEAAAIRTLTRDQKLQVIERLVGRYREATGLPLEYIVTDPEAPEPNGYIVYKKPLLVK